MQKQCFTKYKSNLHKHYTKKTTYTYSALKKHSQSHTKYSENTKIQKHQEHQEHTLHSENTTFFTLIQQQLPIY